MRRYDEWQVIRQRVPDSNVVPEIQRPLDMEALHDREKLIVPYIDGQRTVEEIALHTHNAEFTVSKMISEGLRTNHMRLIENRRRREAVPVAESGTEVEQFLKRGRAQLKKDPQGAYRMFKVANELDPNDGRAADAIREAEKEIKTALQADGVVGERIPELAISMQKLQERSFTPPEGFVLSPINGQSDVKSIMKISPMKELEVLMVFQKFLKDGVIRWKADKRA
jgi:hypothetical protein